MSSQRKTADNAPTASSKKTRVTVTTFNKWRTQLERNHNMLSCIHCDISKEDETVVELLVCNHYRKHEDGLASIRNFSEAWPTETV